MHFKVVTPPLSFFKKRLSNLHFLLYNDSFIQHGMVHLATLKGENRLPTTKRLRGVKKNQGNHANSSILGKKRQQVPGWGTH
jgi:hypothetical protein